jgi:F0F1-type ATP synthase assembly protein I
VWQFTGSAGVGAFAGYLVDRFFGVSPWGLLSGSLGGSGVGFWAFITATNTLSKAAKSGEKKR